MPSLRRAAGTPHSLPFTLSNLTPAECDVKRLGVLCRVYAAGRANKVESMVKERRRGKERKVTSF